MTSWSKCSKKSLARRKWENSFQCHSCDPFSEAVQLRRVKCRNLIHKMICMTALTIRKAILWDYSAIASLHQELSGLHSQWAAWNFEQINPSYNKEIYTERLEDKDTLIFVAECDKKILAYVIFQIYHSEQLPILKKRSWLFMKDIIVSEDQKWKWIGSLLLEKWEEIAKEMNLWSLELHVWSFNEEAIDFYQKRWFQPFAIKMRKTL